MAKIRLGRYEVEEEGLPAVCMRCGAPASVQKHKTFGSRARRIRVPLFFCNRHKNYWVRYGIIIGGSLGLFFTVGFGSVAFIQLIPPGAAPFMRDFLPLW